MSGSKIKVLIVDDSPVARMLLAHLLTGDPRIHVLGSVNDGQAAVDFVRQVKPDVIIMDLHMPVLNGFDATRRIMETHPVPIIICTGTTNPKEVATSFRLMEAGAVACVSKPVAPDHLDYDENVRNLVQMVKLMSEVKVVRRWPRAVPPAPMDSSGREKMRDPGEIQVVGIGASTGGPPVLQTLIGDLPKDFPAPLLIVQHIARGFLPGLVEWLNQTTGWQVQIAAHGTLPLPGHAYFAPDDFQMGVTASGRIVLAHEAPENGLRPSVSYLFRSLATSIGANAIRVILTGMGRDGADELKLMRDEGAVTIAQDRETSIVHGMPGEAIAAGGAVHVLPADKIADVLTAITRQRQPTKRMSL